MTVGERIKNARQAKGWSRQTLAEKTGIVQQSIYRYETGHVDHIYVDSVEAIANALGVLPAELLGWELPNNFKTVQVYDKKPGNEIAPGSGTPVDTVGVLTSEDMEATAVRLTSIPMFPELQVGDIVIRKTPKLN